MRAASSSEKAADTVTGFPDVVLVEAAGLSTGAAAGCLAMNTVERDTGRSPSLSDGARGALAETFVGAGEIEGLPEWAGLG